MAAVVIAARLVDDRTPRQTVRIDVVGVLLSSVGLVLVVFGMLQSKTWGWVSPAASPEIAGVEIAPLGVSLTSWFMVVGGALIYAFFRRQAWLVAQRRSPLVHVEMFSITQLRSGLGVLGAQYAVTAGLFFMVPVYLQMTLGLDPLQTGIRIFPLSISLILFSVVGTRLSRSWSPRRIVRAGQLVLVFSAILLLGSVTPDLRGWLFSVGMFLAGAALGLLASQIGNVNMSAVTEKETSEVGGLQGVFQNLGSSLGTALIGSILVGSLTSTFAAGIASSELPTAAQGLITEATADGVDIVPADTVDAIGQDAGLSADEASELSTIYRESQLSSLRVAFFGLILISALSLVLSRGIPTKVATASGRQTQNP